MRKGGTGNEADRRLARTTKPPLDGSGGDLHGVAGLGRSDSGAFQPVHSADLVRGAVDADYRGADCGAEAGGDEGMTYLEICQAQLPIDEGVRHKPYRDTVGKLTVGVGRNMDDVPFSEEEIALMLKNDITNADRDARSLIPSFDSLSEPRKAVLVNMAFNLGRTRLSGFARFLDAVSVGNWANASSEMLQSKWANQVGGRAIRLAKMMREG